MASRSKKPEVQNPEVQPEAIDLRSAMPLRLAELVADPFTAPEDLVEALLDDGLETSTWPQDPLLEHWRRFLEPLAVLGGRTTYVGSFRVAAQRAAEAATGMAARDREAAAQILLHETSRHASTHQEFVLGFRLALRVDPGLETEVFLGTIARTSPHDQTRVPTAVPLASLFDVLAQRPNPSLSSSDVWGLRAAFARVPEADLAQLDEWLERLHPKDREIVNATLGRPTRRWAFRRH